ncbi:hypothetical protein MRX96_009124 [Rhipicephalus microplus]
MVVRLLVARHLAKSPSKKTQPARRSPCKGEEERRATAVKVVRSHIHRAITGASTAPFCAAGSPHREEKAAAAAAKTQHHATNRALTTAAKDHHLRGKKRARKIAPIIRRYPLPLHHARAPPSGRRVVSPRASLDIFGRRRGAPGRCMAPRVHRRRRRQPRRCHGNRRRRAREAPHCCCYGNKSGGGGTAHVAPAAAQHDGLLARSLVASPPPPPAAAAPRSGSCGAPASSGNCLGRCETLSPSLTRGPAACQARWLFDQRCWYARHSLLGQLRAAAT